MGDKGDKNAARPPEGSLVETRCLIKGPKSAIVPFPGPRSGPKSRTGPGALAENRGGWVEQGLSFYFCKWTIFYGIYTLCVLIFLSVRKCLLAWQSWKFLRGYKFFEFVKFGGVGGWYFCLFSETAGFCLFIHTSFFGDKNRESSFCRPWYTWFLTHF